MSIEAPDADDCFDTSYALVERAMLAFDQADHDEALRLLATAEKRLGTEGALPQPDRDILAVAVLRTRGEILTDLGQHAPAFESLREALELARSSSAVTEVELVGILNATGMLCKYSGRFEEAAAAYDEALVILDGVEMSTLEEGADGLDERGLDDVRAVLLHNVGGNAHANGAFELAEDATNEALALHLELEGEGSYAVASDRAALAAILQATGRAAEAEPLLRSAVRDFDATVGRFHRDTASAFHNLGDALAAQGDTDEAREAFREAIALRRELFGDVHPDLAMSLNNLAVLEARCERLGEARRLLAEASAIVDATLDADHPLARMTRGNRQALSQNAADDCS